MPGSDDADGEMADSVLTRFISIPEQTYGEFLSSFTFLPPGRQQPQVLFDVSQRKTPSTDRTQDETGAANGQDDPEQVDNYFNSSDIDKDRANDGTGPSVLLFPGEAALDPDGASTTVVRNTTLQIHTSFAVERTAEEVQSCMQQHLGDDIQPFSLDQSFDYERVVLTSKVSAQEMNFLRLREPQVVEMTAGET